MSHSPPHLAIFLRYLGGGGAETILLNLAQSFSQQNCKVDLVLGKAWGRHCQKVPSTINIVDLGASGFFSTLISLIRYLRKEQPTGLLSALHYANEIAICAKHLAKVSTPVVVTEHNTLSQALQHEASYKKYLLPLSIRYLYPWADAVVTVSQGVAQDLAQTTGLPAQNIKTIYNPVVTPELKEKAKVPLDHPWFAPGEPPVILGVGKLEAQKDFPTLIHAFAKVRKMQPARLMILGWGSERSQLEALIKELHLENDVALTGYIDNPYPYIANAQVFVLSSAWEGLPTVLIEAMALGTPIISTNCKSGPAEILDHGKYGFLMPVGDRSAIAKAILAVLSGEAKTNQSTWLEQFTPEVVTPQYLKILNIYSTK